MLAIPRRDFPRRGFPRHGFLKIRARLEVDSVYFKRIPDNTCPPGIRGRRADSE